MVPSDQHKNDLSNGAAGGDGRTLANGRPGEGDRWLRSVVENSSEIVTVVDPDGTLRYANPACERALGYDPDGAIENVEDTAIARMVIELAHTLGMEVIAEGVESEEQARLLREMGCNMAQGFHFAKPLSPEAASKFLTE